MAWHCPECGGDQERCTCPVISTEGPLQGTSALMTKVFDNGTTLYPDAIYKVGLTVTDPDGTVRMMQPSIWAAGWNILSIVKEAPCKTHETAGKTPTIRREKS